MLDEATAKLGVILYPVQVITHWCILATNSGGRARYWVCRGDDDKIYTFKLNDREILELEEQGIGN